MAAGPGQQAGGCPDRQTLEAIGAGVPAGDDTRAHVDACATCRRALEQIRADNELFAEAAVAIGDELQADAGAGEGVAGYEIISEIHRGGQGVVYKAHHRPTNRDVALKMLLLGAFATSDQRARFEREAELVANLRHPGIVTLYDTGITPDGRPYLAMEYVQGRQLKPAITMLGDGPPVRRVLELFAGIADAVHYAHQRGVIHRDLKPSNVIVDDDSRPHVLDFGIAKAVTPPATDDDDTDASEQPTQLIDSVTRTGEFVGTFLYASPEQVGGDPHAIDVRTDVYSLGMMLYEALTSRRPYVLDGSMADIVQTITATSPRPPSLVRRDVDHEVETIVLTCLAKDPDRRYQSAGELRDDILRYLAGDPIHAKRDSRLYVARKIAWKYRVPLGAAALFLIVVNASLVTIALQNKNIARAAQNQLAAETASSQAIHSIITEKTDTPIQNVISDAAREELYDRFAEVWERELATFPKTLANREFDLGLAYTDISAFDKAVDHLSRALELRRTTAGDPSPSVAETLHELGRVHWRSGEYDEAERYYTQARAMRRDLLGAQSPDYAVSTQHLAATLSRQGRYAEAEPLYREALSILMADPDTSDEALDRLGSAHNGLSTILWILGQFEEARAELDAARQINLRMRGPDDWRVGRMTHTLGVYDRDLQRFDEAEREFREALRIKLIWREATDREIARTEVQLARLVADRALWTGWRPDEAALDDAIAMCEQALSNQHAVYSDAHEDLGVSHQVLARLLSLAGSVVAAQQHVAAARENWLALHGPEHWRLGVTDSIEGAILAGSGSASDARALMERGYARIVDGRPLGADDPRARDGARRLVVFFSAGGNAVEASQWQARIKPRPRSEEGRQEPEVSRGAAPDRK